MSYKYIKNEQESFWSNKFGNDYVDRDNHDPIKSLNKLFQNIFLKNNLKISNFFRTWP